MKPFSIIVALDQKNGIGKAGALPWQIPADLKYFAQTTSQTEDQGKQNAIIMGRKTWDSLPSDKKPLQNRINVVLSRNPNLELPAGVLQFGGLNEALLALHTSPRVEQAFVIGGASLYQEAVLHEMLDKIYITKIENSFECDVFFPDRIPGSFEIVAATDLLTDNGHEYANYVLSKDQFDEMAGCCGGGCCGEDKTSASCGGGACGSGQCENHSTAKEEAGGCCGGHGHQH